jgi:hypothetical protein
VLFLFLIYLSILFVILVKTTIKIAKEIGRMMVPIPTNIPIAEANQIKAAVVTPTTLSSCFIITPLLKILFLL